MSATVSASPREQLSEGIQKLWWIPLFRGVVLVALGCYALFFPTITALAFTKVVGIFLFVEGILAIIAAILGRAHSRIATFARGVLDLLLGAFVFAYPVLVAGVTATVILYVIAFGVIAAGLLEIFTAIRDRKEIEGEGWLMLGGALAVLFGVLLLGAPLAFGVFMVRVLGAYAIIFGISLIAFAFRVRRFGKALNQ